MISNAPKSPSRNWEELRGIGNELADGHTTPQCAVAEAARHFEVPQSSEEHAVASFLDGLSRAFDDKSEIRWSD